jgi:hypothetical protein
LGSDDVLDEVIRGELSFLVMSHLLGEYMPDPKLELSVESAERDESGGVSGSPLLLPDEECVGDDLRVLGAEVERSARFRAIFAAAAERCSCDVDAKRTSTGSNGMSTTPDRVDT